MADADKNLVMGHLFDLAASKAVFTQCETLLYKVISNGKDGDQMRALGFPAHADLLTALKLNSDDSPVDTTARDEALLDCRGAIEGLALPAEILHEHNCVRDAAYFRAKARGQILVAASAAAAAIKSGAAAAGTTTAASAKPTVVESAAGLQTNRWADTACSDLMGSAAWSTAIPLASGASADAEKLWAHVHVTVDDKTNQFRALLLAAFWSEQRDFDKDLDKPVYNTFLTGIRQIKASLGARSARNYASCLEFSLDKRACLHAVSVFSRPPSTKGPGGPCRKQRRTLQHGHSWSRRW